jgi:hypothetical protein
MIFIWYNSYCQLAYAIFVRLVILQVFDNEFLRLIFALTKRRQLSNVMAHWIRVNPNNIPKTEKFIQNQVSAFVSFYGQY